MNLVSRILTNKALILIFIIISITLCAPGLQLLKIDNNTQDFIDLKSRDKIIYDEITEQFTAGNATIILVKGDIFSPKILTHLDNLVKDLTELKHVTKAESLFNVNEIVLHKKKIKSQAFIQAIPTSKEDADKIKSRALNNPLINKNLISENAQSTIILLYDDIDQSDTEKILNFRKSIKKQISPYRQYVTAISIVGSTEYTYKIIETLSSSIFQLLLIACVVYFITLYFFHGNLLAALLPFITSTISLVITFGLMGYFGITINLFNAMLPILILVIGSTEDIHLLAAYESIQKKHTQSSPLVSADIMLKKFKGALILCIITTFIGFFSNVFSNIYLIRDFAIASSLGILVNGIITLLLIPILVQFTYKSRTNKLSVIRDHFLEKCHQIILKLISLKPHVILSMISIVAFISIFLIRNISTNNNPGVYFYDSEPLIQNIEYIDNNHGGSQSLYVYLKAKSGHDFHNPALLKNLFDITEFIKSKDEYLDARSYSNFIAHINQTLHENDKSYYKTPDSRKNIRLFNSALTKKQLQANISDDFTKAVILVQHTERKTGDLLADIKQLEDEIQMQLNPNIVAEITSLSKMFGQSVLSVSVQQIISVCLIIFSTFITMSILFSSVRVGLIASIPNLFPILLTFAFASFFKLDINPVSALVAIVGIGLAVDDTIHLLSKYIQHCYKYDDNQEAIEKTLKIEIKPVIITSISLIIGFSVLTLSSFKAVSDFGILMCVTIFSAMLTDLILTPVLIRKYRFIHLWDYYDLQLPKAHHSYPLFNELTSHEIKLCLLLSVRKQYNYDETILNASSKNHHVYMILRGGVTIQDNSHSFKLSTGDTFGVLTALCQNQADRLVTANQSTEVLVLKTKQLALLSENYPVLSQKLSTNFLIMIGTELKALNITGPNMN